jgi:hypothetical protein
MLALIIIILSIILIVFLIETVWKYGYRNGWDEGVIKTNQERDKVLYHKHCLECGTMLEAIHLKRYEASYYCWICMKGFISDWSSGKEERIILTGDRETFKKNSNDRDLL